MTVYHAYFGASLDYRIEGYAEHSPEITFSISQSRFCGSKDNCIPIVAKLIVPTSEQIRKGTQWIKDHKVSKNNQIISLSALVLPDTANLSKIGARFERYHQRYWCAGNWGRSISYKNVLVADTLDVAMHTLGETSKRAAAQSRGTSLPSPTEFHVLESALKLLEAYEFLREPWKLWQTNIPIPSVLASQFGKLALPTVIVRSLYEFNDVAASLVRNKIFYSNNFFLFLSMFVLLHNIDLSVAEVIRLRPEMAAECVVRCFHGYCDEHCGIARDWHEMMKLEYLDKQQISYLKAVIKFTERPGSSLLLFIPCPSREWYWFAKASAEIQMQLLQSQKSMKYNDNRSYWALQLFQKGWKPIK
ncbi:hypothetical protein GGS21DRAFT_488546 [Xylaria nigripes]|nr:hypothetical protein GGS21DRAFT_488546 [Xylaria nigripes]